MTMFVANRAREACTKTIKPINVKI